MCRLYALLANVPTKVECSLVDAQNRLMERTRCDSVDRGHADGWGVVCYDENLRYRIPTTIRHSNAAFDTDHFSRSVQSVYSRAVVAHVRMGTVGCASTLNAHPFTHDAWTFAHHGEIPWATSLEEKLMSQMEPRFQNCRLGTTDSELLFLWLLSQLKSHGVTDANVAENFEVAQRVLAESFVRLTRECSSLSEHRPKLNFALTNGRVLFAGVWGNPMYQLIRDQAPSCSRCGRAHTRPNHDDEYRAVAFASEPITDEPWFELQGPCLVGVNEGLACNVETVPLNDLLQESH